MYSHELLPERLNDKGWEIEEPYSYESSRCETYCSDSILIFEGRRSLSVDKIGVTALLALSIVLILSQLFVFMIILFYYRILGLI
ncbi:hypothetical protein S7335_1319 [Synechococcus sp. PCC 7335]|uniref:hypothetical protein n=1 Tax=Synechococcus sp. (strain ATCC 29403 / PCC 7335) TaxID=91464 RepID=UPI00017EE13E|nr:hypothetical protein [Synechococcus sp. PCC 7335]EDX82615.1 hypothetical protein S7335_1319 [Synechococcus sp. PCC 7335]